MRYKNANQTDLEFLQLKGKIKKLMQTVYKVDPKSSKIEPGKIEVGHGSVDKNFIYTFGDNGNIVEEDVYGKSFRDINTLDELGRKVEEKKYYKGEYYTTTTYKHLNNSHLITESVVKDAGGNLMYRYTNLYTDTEQLLEHFTYHLKHGIEFVYRKEINTYREEVYEINNRKWRDQITSTEYDKDGKISKSSISTFNEKGQCIERNAVYSDTSLAQLSGKTTYKYNEYGDVIETNQYYTDGTLKNSYVSTHNYDSEGKKITPPPPPSVYYEAPDPIHLDVPGTEKDATGNWIRKNEIRDNMPGKIIIREIVYEGEEKTLEHPLSKIENMVEETEKEPDYESYKLEQDEAKWLADLQAAAAESFPHTRYYALRFKEPHSLVFYQGPNIEAMMVLKKLQEVFYADIIHSYATVWNGTKRIQRYTLCFPGHWGYMLHCNGTSTQDPDEFILPQDFEDRDDVTISNFTLFCPSDVSKMRDEHFEEQISGIIYDCSLRKKPEKPMINIIEVKQGSFSIKEYAVHDNFIIKDLDVNYGHGFEKFHNELMQRFNSSTKGLVLFHGVPGTGKTYYIRHLLRKMVANHKDVIYIPPNMVDHLVDPAFMTFLSSELKSWSEDGHSCVLLIEDAEPLLAKRQEGVRIQGVTNLLNMTDGLLNDMLNIQIICTFNVDLRKLDSALLRPGRLIARKEFKALSELDANLLGQRLGIKHHFKKPATLGEIYAMRKNHNTLIHDVEPDRNASTQIDDLI